jgi:hypothetical protein
MNMMRLKVSFTKMLAGLLLACLLPGAGFSHIQQSVAPSQIIFEISTKEWGMFGGDCSQMLNFRLYADGRVEYDICQYKNLEGGRASSSVLGKELKLTAKEVAAFVQLVEQSGFLGAYSGYHSGKTGTDVGADTTIIYRNQNTEKKVLIKNYHPDSKQIPEFIHKLLEKVFELMPKDQ